MEEDRGWTVVWGLFATSAILMLIALALRIAAVLA